MESHVFECIVQKDDTKLRDSRNVKTNILSPISTKKEAIYLTNYPTYRGRGYVRNNNKNNSNNNAIIEDRVLDSSRRETFVVTEDDKENFIGKQEDRLNNFPSTKRQEILPTLLSFDEKNNEGNSLKRKIPRPANAFMLFANEWRKKLASENPRESNKDISVRLGILWKNISKDMKEKYFTLAREVDAEHKKKYPGMSASSSLSSSSSSPLT
ncbi:sex-determining region Y protein-like isoform X1 [Vespa mandarinia]|uniref:sex-determining region Y protein-like isoform X1 n=1 Tax=Vespa mandarinia TaxID=7446 RepID=UPI0016145046|nr:sex-determining region Y protein-like isoform X1 [Vespa mandarinia]